MRFTVPAAVLYCAMSAAVQPEAVMVHIDDFAFDPPEITVSPGATVIWTNRDDMPHTISSGSRPDSFASAALDTGETFSHQFERAGRFSYFCGLHPKMQGVVTVR